jgi:hypothetical protein
VGNAIMKLRELYPNVTFAVDPNLRPAGLGVEN